MLKQLFVYGSLRTGAFNYDKYLKKYNLTGKSGSISGNLFQIENKGYPANQAGQGKIIGECFEIPENSSLLAEMDELEGYEKSNPENSEYIRKEVTVQLENGSTMTAYFYNYNPKADYNKEDKLIPITTGNWFDSL